MATRTERVVLELESNISTQATRDAAAVALLKRELGGLDGASRKSSVSTKSLASDTDSLSKRAVDGSSSIDRYSGRLSLLAQVAAGLGPALIPIGAIGIPAAVGFANALAGAGLGAGTAMLAFQDMGSALTALNKAALDPTVTNLNAAQLALEKLPPAARDFARELAAMQPTLQRLRQSAAAGLFPGLEDALNELRTRSDDVEKILFRVGTTLGDLSREGATALAGPQWDDFMAFIGREAPQALAGMGHAIGDVIHGLAQLWMAFAPLNHDLLGVIVQAADGFDRWATGLGRTAGFTEFIDYLKTNGPLVANAVMAIGNAVLQIVEASAPLGGPILQALTAVANAIATIAGSPAGPTIMATVTALALLSRAQATFGTISDTSWGKAIRNAETFGSKVSAARGPLTRGGLALAGIGLAATGAADSLGIANTATLALTGSIAGPWGAAAGAAVGLFLDMAKNTKSFTINSQELTDTLNKQTGAITQNTRAYVAQQLQQQGILTTAQSLGLSLSDVTSAALGNQAALARVNEELATTKAAFYDASGQAKVSAGTLYDFAQRAGDVKGAIGDTSGAIHDAQGNIGQLNLALSRTGTGFDATRTAAERFRIEIDRVTDTLNRRGSLRSYHQALLDFQAALKQNGTTLDQNTQAGIDNQAALDAIAQSAITAAQNLKGLDQRRFLANAKQQFLDAAEALGMDSDKAKALADNLFHLNNIVAKPKVYVDGISESLAKLEAVAAHLRALHDRTVRITTIRSTGGRTLAGYAEGGTVTGSRAPYGDKVLTWLAPGEEVISNRFGQADQHRALLKAINARRYAEGGTVAQSRVSVNVAGASVVGGGTSIDYGQLAQAMAAMRPAPPLYGDVHISGDPSVWRRQMEQDRAMAELSGVRRG